MAQFIILTKNQADIARGPSIPGAALDPRELADGKFALPVEVLDDVAHAQKEKALRLLPVVDESAIVWKDNPARPPDTVPIGRGKITVAGKTVTEDSAA